MKLRNRTKDITPPGKTPAEENDTPHPAIPVRHRTADRYRCGLFDRTETAEPQPMQRSLSVLAPGNELRVRRCTGHQLVDRHDKDTVPHVIANTAAGDTNSNIVRAVGSPILYFRFKGGHNRVNILPQMYLKAR